MFGTLNIAFLILLILWKLQILKIITSFINSNYLSQVEFFLEKIQTKKYLKFT